MKLGGPEGASTGGQAAERDIAVVGVGASAGGLEALREMFEGHDGRTGMAFVVIQHLDPTHESLMAQLIERYTRMKVRQAQGGEDLAADEIYVIPPGHGLAVEDGRLRLTEFTDPRGLRRPIDDFFVSLAEDRGPRSACVILSGTGADGSRGLRAIKEHGGIAVAQSPDSARYDGMPTAAIGTGLIDIEAEPEDIIERLKAFFDNGTRTETVVEEATEVLDHVDALCDRIVETIGHDFSGYKRPTLTRRIARRMQVLGLEDASDYLARVRRDQDECDALFRDLLINVTRFFRDTQDFMALKEKVIDPLVADLRDGQELRVWVAGCSSGEEAYTVAMILAEAAREQDVRPYFQVFATDIDDKMLQIARSGSYPLSALNDIPEPYRERYTVGSADHFSVNSRIRDMVRFSLHNLVRDPPFANVDIVTCRNLLIYLGDDLQKQVLPIFHFALRRDTGHLFLGSSEAIGRFEDLFATVDQSARLFQRKDVRSRYTLNVPTSRAAMVSQRRALRPRPEDRPRASAVETLALTRIAEKYAPVSMLVDEEGILLERWGSIGRFLDFPKQLDRNVHVPQLARPGLREALGPLLRQTRTNERRTGVKDVAVQTEYGTVPVDIVCEPVSESSYLVILRETGPLTAWDEEFDSFEVEEGQTQYLEEELQNTRLRLRTTVEELETTNEELKSSNEEMMSMNEELQSTNEELTTVNDELKTKVDQLTVANSDLRNFFDSTELVVLVCDPDLRLRSYTQAALDIFDLSSSDIGRPLSSLRTRLESDEYVDFARRSATTGDRKEGRIRSSTGAEYLVRAFPYRYLDGDIGGATLVMTDVTRVLALEDDLEQERQRLQLALDVSNVGIWEYEPSTDRTVLDETERRLLDIAEGDEGSSLEPILARLPGEDRDRINRALRQAMDGKSDFDEIFRLPLRSGETRWLHGLGRLIQTGETSKFIGATFDITPERELLGQREIMIREMNHRVKNLFAVIAGMVSMSAKTADDVASFADDIRSRIHALGRSHALTNDGGNLSDAPLGQLIDTVIAPSKSGQEVVYRGPDLMISAPQITPLALIFHEWATNSSKYGALSEGGGRIEVDWSADGDTVEVRWTETGGETGQAGGAAGFGTTLVEVTSRQLGGEATGKATPDGYVRTLRFERSG